MTVIPATLEAEAEGLLSLSAGSLRQRSKISCLKKQSRDRLFHTFVDKKEKQNFPRVGWFPGKSSEGLCDVQMGIFKLNALGTFDTPYWIFSVLLLWDRAFPELVAWADDPLALASRAECVLELQMKSKLAVNILCIKFSFLLLSKFS